MTARVLFDDTAAVNLQGRQYRLFNFDLGEGVVREHLALGAGVAVAWAVVMLLARPIMPPFPIGVVVALWVGPPWLLVKAALLPDRGGRPRYALWYCRARYLARRHRPMVPPLGHRPICRLPTRLEPLVRPTRSPGAARPFTVRAEFEVLPSVLEEELTSDLKDAASGLTDPADRAWFDAYSTFTPQHR